MVWFFCVGSGSDPISRSTRRSLQHLSYKGVHPRSITQSEDEKEELNPLRFLIGDNHLERQVSIDHDLAPLERDETRKTAHFELYNAHVTPSNTPTDVGR